MRNLKRYIITLVVVLIIILLFIAIINYIGKEDEVRIGEIEGDIETELVRLDNYNTYYSIEKMMNNYYLYLRVQNKTAVYSLLDKEYMEQNSINEDNVINKISNEKNTEDGINVKEVYVKQDLQNPTFLIKTNVKKDINQISYYIFYQDNEQGAFAIKPIKEEEYNSYVQRLVELEIKGNKIQRNNYNRVLNRTLEEEELVEKYFEDYLQNALYNVEEAYKLLDEEYSQKKFGNIEEYKKYLNNRQEQLTSMDYNSIKELQDFKTEEEYIEYLSNLKTAGLEKYQINEYEDYTQYICIDDYGNSYIFNSTSAFQYVVLLDTYTVDLQKSIEKYNGATEEEKVLLNIQKMIDATKDGDYKYVYSKLDDIFKANYFSDYNDFKEYLESNLSEENVFGYKNIEKHGDVYVADIIINDKKEISVIMKLDNDTNFYVSFNIEE